MRVLTTGSVAALLFVLAACGGGTATTAQPTDAGAPTTAEPTDGVAPASAAATDPSAAESEGTIPEPTTGSGGGGTGFASHPCDLVSQSDAEAAAGVTGLASSVLTVDASSSICSWRDANGQAEVYAGVWEGAAGSGQWDAIKLLAESTTDGIEMVDGLGGDAIYTTQGDVLLVHKGDTLVQITVRSPELTDPAAVRAAVLGVGEAVLARL